MIEGDAPRKPRRRRLLWSLEPPPEVRGDWNRITFLVTGVTDRSLLILTITDSQGLVPDILLHLPRTGRPDGERQVVAAIPRGVGELRLTVVGPDSRSASASKPRFARIGRARASALLLARTPVRQVVALIRHAHRPGHLLRHLRSLLAESSRAAYGPSATYEDWLRLFDQWSIEDFDPATPRARLSYFVFAGDAGPTALAATLSSIDAQPLPAPRMIVSGNTAPDALRAWLMEHDAEYVAILQAGEVLPFHAAWLGGQELVLRGHPEIAVADEDEMAEDGSRSLPRFRPVPSHVAMLSGLQASGLWFVRRDTLTSHLPSTSDWAEAFRLDLWLRRHRTSPNKFSDRIPFILSHRRPDAAKAPSSVLSTIVTEHLERGDGPALRCVASTPLRLSLREDAPTGHVTILVPSTLRQAHCLRCISAILEETDYPSFELKVVVMQPDLLDETQRAAADRIRADPRATVTWLRAASFNFSTANNHVAGGAGGEHILLLNDDVSPIRPDWLRYMTAFMADPRIGIVGARLLYPNDLVQHGGVIMGLAGLCDHAHRFLPRAEPGYMSRAVTSQELSVVTAACMLVRRSLYEKVGGLDEDYPSAFNDVDFALRVGETGHSIIYSAETEMYHHELQTYGDHYAGERQAFAEAEVMRMRHRWSGVVEADPFHNPNLSLAPFMEWHLAFPPRLPLYIDEE